MQHIGFAVSLMVIMYMVFTYGMGKTVPRILSYDRWTFRVAIEFALSIIVMYLSLFYVIMSMIIF